MISFAAVYVHNPLINFSAKLHPIGTSIDERALAAIGLTHEDTLKYPSAEIGMKNFHIWLTKNGTTTNKVQFWSDNLAFDWQFINYYFNYYNLSNPFGYSGRRIGDLYSGLENDLAAHTKWKKFRKTPHTHNPLDDAKGNAEALRKIFTILQRRAEDE